MWNIERILRIPPTGTVLLALVSMLAYAQSPPSMRYAISIGAPPERVSSGTLWLYSYSWYGLQKIEWAAVKNGLALVPLDSAELQRKLDPHPATDAYVVVLQTGEHRWYRTPDIRPHGFWNNLSSAINSLGKVTPSSAGETQLILAPLTKRRLTLLYPDGKAAANAEVTLSIYLWNMNHCGFHEGLPLGTFRTDSTGTIEVLAPLVPLYFDGIPYYEPKGTGPAGIAYSDNLGLKTGPEENLILKKEWQLNDVDNLSEEAELRVLTQDGRARKDVDIYVDRETNTCSSGVSTARTNAKGVAHVIIDPSVIGLDLMIGGPYSPTDPKFKENLRTLTSNELHELFSKHNVTIRW